MLRLPRIPNAVQRYASEIVQLQGINYSDAFRPGDIAESRNVSAHRYPYLSARKARQKLDGYSGISALFAWEKLVAVRGTELLYDGQVVGSVLSGEKQMAVVNTKLVIWPDMVYLDIVGRTLHSLAASAAGTGAVFTEDSVTVTGWPDLTALFSPGDTLTVSGCTEEAANNKDVTVKAVTASQLTLTEARFAPATETGALQISRRVPDLDYICSSENRLWGCSNSSKTIYASALGDPTNFYTYNGLSTDSYALAVGSEGDFTGCTALSNSVLFWKENTLHKMLGGYPAEYSLYSYNVEGLRKGCHKSMQIINEMLFYVGVNGVYVYSGGSPSKISDRLGSHDLTDAAAGSDGDHYYLSVQDGADRRYLTYDIRLGIWLQEDETDCTDFARLGRELYFLDSLGDVWRHDTDADDPDVDWLVQFTPFYETVNGRKCYSRILLRTELPKGAWLQAEVRCDGRTWQTAGRIVGSGSDTRPIVLCFSRCDKFEVRLSGHGPFALKAMLREFRVGSDA